MCWGGLSGKRITVFPRLLKAKLLDFPHALDKQDFQWLMNA